MTEHGVDTLELLRRDSLLERFEIDRAATTETGLAAAADPTRGFWERAAPLLMNRAPGSARSAIFEWYDLFHEFGERHAVGSRDAFTDFSTSTGLQSVGYRELVARALALASHWSRAGVGPGCTVCVVFDPSTTYVALLLAAWHCGAAVCVVPPSGREFTTRALGHVIEHVDGRVVHVVSPKAETWLDTSCERLEWRTLALSGRLRPAYRFASDEIAAYAFSPLSVDWTPVPLGAEQLYLGALRDALLLLQLGPRDVLSAPGFCDLQFKPSLILATLAAGARWVEFDEAELQDCRVVNEAGVSVLGVCRVVRRLLVGSAASVPASVRRWVRNVGETSDDGAREVELKLERAGVLGMNYLANSAAAGGMLFSDWVGAPSAVGVLRAPGLGCELTEPNGTQMPQLSDVGVLTPAADFEPARGQRMAAAQAAVGRVVLAQTPKDNVWVTNLGSHRDGKVLPEPLIEELLMRLYPGKVRAAIIVSLPQRQRASVPSDRLVVFARPSEPALSGRELEVALRKALGADWAPSSVCVFELNPRLVAPDDPESEVDRVKCAAQYLDGTLWAKARAGGVFRELASLAPEFTLVMQHLSATSSNDVVDDVPHIEARGRAVVD